jgi:serine/threonine protein kinase
MYNNLTNLIPLKTGGQKEVYSAEHPIHGKVVFKKIKPNSEGLERTKREIRAALIIDSTYVPKIIAHNCNEISPQYLWLVEKFVPGVSLRELLENGRKFNTKEVVRFLDIMLNITVKSEKKELVHRDIKPDNIIFGVDGNFHLLDFGIARHLDLESLTASNNHFGLFTIGYASSEQFRNKKRDIDIRTDLFSIGVVCYEMLKGENFYTVGVNHDFMRVLKKLENSSLPPLRINGDTQFQLSTFIRMLGDHRRTRRPRTAQEALNIFNTLLDTLKLN